MSIEKLFESSGNTSKARAEYDELVTALGKALDFMEIAVRREGVGWVTRHWAKDVFKYHSAALTRLPLPGGTDSPG